MRSLPVAVACWALAISCAASPPAAVAPGASGAPRTAAGSPVPAARPAAPLDGWEKIRDEDGIVVHRREVEGSPLVAFRGEGIIEAPIAKVALVQMDLAHAHEWIDRLVEARVLEVRSETSFLTYSHIGAPPTVSDRDFVNEVNIEFDPPRNIKFRLNSVDSPAGPTTDFVRGKLHHSSFVLTALDEKRTHLVCEIHADPKGAIPKFVVNFVQKGWAFQTITQLRTQTKRSDVVDRAPQIRDLLRRRGFQL